MKACGKSRLAAVHATIDKLANKLTSKDKFQIALVALAVISGFTTILSAQPSIRCVSFLALALVVPSFLIASIVASRQKVPQVDSLDFLPSAPYRIVAATEEDVLWAADTARRVYSGLDIIPAGVMLEWFNANPNGFSVIKDREGRRCGNVDILPLKPDTLKRFLHGDLIEREIRGDSIFASTNSKKIDTLYVESLVSLSEGDRGNPLATYRCIMSAPDLVGRLCAHPQITRLYAIGASRSGIRLMEHLGFEAVKYEEQRRDGHQVFSVSLPDLLRNILEHANGTDKGRLISVLTGMRAEPTL